MDTYIHMCVYICIRIYVYMGFFEIGSHCITQGGLELTIHCLSLPSNGITSVNHHTQL
jgi:hypothetical protein